ncbi:MAG TPA: HD domain-containing phosphohydrolase [Gaiellaceae bacterium]|nr:HD domain-containing phosphohydrolase [Gaiellaceae bacterium]
MTLLWIAALTVGCVAVAGTLLGQGYQLPSVWTFGALALVTAAAERQSVRVARNVETSVAFLPFVFSAVAFGPLGALAVGLMANALDFRRPYLRWAIYVPARGLTGALTGLAAARAVPAHSSFVAITVATIVASVANVVFDGAFNVSTLLIRKSAPVSAFVKSVGPFALLSLPLYVPLVAVMVYASERYSFWTAAMFLAPTVAFQRVVHLYQKQREVSDKLVTANARLEAANLSFAAALVTTLDARDRYTAGHSASVATYARDIAARLGLSDEEQQLAHTCGLVHDVGKVGLPPGLLEKPGPLSLEERRHMEQHPVIGERILKNVADYGKIALVVRHHHERVDGHGYPDGLREDAIPLISRIIAVADAYDAMTSDRPYRDAMPPQVARLRMAQAVGSQFDTTVVAAFEAILAQATEDYRVGLGPEFVFETLAEREIATYPSARPDPAFQDVHARVS